MIQTSQIPHQRSWFMIASIVAFGILAVFSIFFQVKRASLRSEIEELTARKQTLIEERKKAAENGLTTLTDIAKVKSQLMAIEANQLLWSKVIEQIEKTVPKKENPTKDPIVQIRSYNASEDGVIAVSATTRRDSVDPFTDVSLLIRAFTQEPSFKNVFVPSITKTVTLESDPLVAGQKGDAPILSFSMNFHYQKPNF